MKTVSVKDVSFGPSDFGLIAGPCVIESEDHAIHMAGSIKEIVDGLNIKMIFKSSFDKANRSSITSFRGLGVDKGLKILDKVKSEIDVPTLTDIHLPEQADPVSEVVDIIQIPAFYVDRQIF